MEPTQLPLDRHQPLSPITQLSYQRMASTPAASTTTATPAASASVVPVPTIGGDDQAPLPIPNLTLPQHVFILSSSDLSHLHEKSRAALLEGIEKDGQLVVPGPDQLARSLTHSPALLIQRWLLISSLCSPRLLP